MGLFNPLVFWVLAVVVSYGGAVRYAGLHHLDRKYMAVAGLCAGLGAFTGGPVCEFLHSVFEGFQTTGMNLASPAGNGVFGALAGAFLLGALVLRWRNRRLLPYADAAAPAVALGYAVARFGCFFNGCCYGTPCQWPLAVWFPKGTPAFYHQWSAGWIDSAAAASLPVHPVQLYHAAVGLLLFFLLRRVRGRPPGTRLALGLGGYGLLRFFLQFLRGDRVPVFGWLDINQIFSIGFVMIAVLLVWNRIRKPASSPGDQPVSSPAEELQPESF